MSGEFADSGGHYYPLVMEDGTLCMQRAFESDGVTILHQQYDGRTAITRKLLVESATVDDIMPEPAALPEVAVGREPVTSDLLRNQIARPFVEYAYYNNEEGIGVGITIYDPHAGKRDDVLCSAVIRTGEPVQLALMPFPRGETYGSVNYETLDEALTNLRPALHRLLGTPNIFHHMERSNGSGSDYSDDIKDERVPEARDYVRDQIRELIAALFPDDTQMQLQAYMLMKGLGVIEMQAGSLSRHTRWSNAESIAASQTLPYDDQLTLLAERIMRHIDKLDALLPEPVVFCALNETGVAHALRSSEELPNPDADDEEELFMAELLPKNLAPYHEMIQFDGGNFAYRFDPEPNGMLITLFAKNETGYTPRYQLLLGTCNPAAVTAIGNNPRANFCLIPRELAKVTYIDPTNGQKISSADLAS